MLHLLVRSPGCSLPGHRVALPETSSLPSAGVPACLGRALGTWQCPEQGPAELTSQQDLGTHCGFPATAALLTSGGSLTGAHPRRCGDAGQSPWPYPLDARSSSFHAGNNHRCPQPWPRSPGGRVPVSLTVSVTGTLATGWVFPLPGKLWGLGADARLLEWQASVRSAWQLPGTALTPRPLRALDFHLGSHLGSVFRALVVLAVLWMRPCLGAESRVQSHDFQHGRHELPAAPSTRNGATGEMIFCIY